MDDVISEYKSSIRSLPSDLLLKYIHEIVTNAKTSVANNIYEKRIQRYIPRDVLPYFASRIAQDAIIHSNPHRGNKDLEKHSDILFSIFKRAKEVYIDKLSVKIGENNAYNFASFIFRLADTQLFNGLFPLKFARSLIMFCEIAPKIRPKFGDLFSTIDDVPIKEFLKSVLLIFSLTQEGYFCNQFTSEDKRLILPEQGHMIKTLDILSSNHKEFRGAYKDMLPENKDFHHSSFNPLRIKPIIQPTSNTCKKNKYIAPLPLLVPSQTTEIIYYNLHKKFFNSCGNSFTEWFGDLMAEYVGFILKKHIVAGEGALLTEEEIEKCGCRDKKKPDFLFVDKRINAAILIECKAARRYRGAVHSDDEKQLFGITSKHLKTAFSQIDEFAQNIRNEKTKIKCLADIEIIIGVVITLEDLVVFNNTGVKREALLNTSYCDYTHVLSLESLEKISRIDNRKISFSDLFFQLKAADDPDSRLCSLINDNSKTNEKCFLENTTQDFIETMVKK